MIITEVCIDSVAGAQAAEQGGADRVELCANLLEGGTTPSAGMIRSVRRSTSLPVMVMIRPRGGHFCFSPAELATMRAEAEAALEEGIAGIVIGALRVDGGVDESTCAMLRELDGGHSVTFHRAFDQTKEPFTALETLIKLGVARVLTSGQAPSAWEGRERLRQLVEAARGRIAIMAGAGIRDDNVQGILEHTAVTEVHFSARQLVDDPIPYWRTEVLMSGQMTPGDLRRSITSVEQVRSICRAARAGRSTQR
jgi:copper homeostasis protein